MHDRESHSSPQTTVIDARSRVGKLAASHAGASRVFMRHKIDFCCAGNRTLGEACEERGLQVERVARDILDESRAPQDGAEQDAAGWEGRPLRELLSHIVMVYHAPLRDELPRLLGMAEKVHRVHGARDPERLSGLARVLRLLTEDLMDHMKKEEEVLFPWILTGRGELATSPVHAMLLEHDDAGRMLDEIRVLTDEFVPPPGACATWRALWAGLSQLDASLRVHIHLENNVLFPRTLAGEGP